MLPTLHPIYESQQEDSITAHVESELIPVTHRLKDAGYKVSLVVGFDKDPVDAILAEIKNQQNRPGRHVHPRPCRGNPLLFQKHSRYPGAKSKNTRTTGTSFRSLSLTPTTQLRTLPEYRGIRAVLLSFNLFTDFSQRLCITELRPTGSLVYRGEKNE